MMQQYKMIYRKSTTVARNYPVGKLDECIATAHRLAACGYTVTCHLVMDGETTIEPFLRLPKAGAESELCAPFSTAELFANA